jgi:UDP-N-acetylglucosamine 1-carboxyvinyltransferase
VQAQLTALALLAGGTSRLTDRVFPKRFAHLPGLERLGARLQRLEDRVLIAGPAMLNGADVTASDLRATSAIVLAGLAAQGTTIIRRVDQLDRGYDRLDAKLNQLGARIERFADSEHSDLSSPSASRALASAAA